MSSIAQNSTRHAVSSFDSDIAALGNALDALHALASSFPADVTVPLERRAKFAHMADVVDAMFEELALAAATERIDSTCDPS